MQESSLAIDCGFGRREKDRAMSTASGPHALDPAEAAYRARLLTTCEVPFLIDRRLTISKDAGGYPPDIASAYRSALRAREPEIGDILSLPNMVVLAEPGAGKSTVTKTAALALLLRPDFLPVRISLLECSRDRSVRHLIAVALNGLALDADLKFYYLLDGIDEVPRELLERTSAEIAVIRDEDRTAGLLATSRQAFYVAHHHQLPQFHSVYHLLDFSNRDIVRYLKARGWSMRPSSLRHNASCSSTRFATPSI